MSYQDNDVSQQLNYLYKVWDGARIRGWYNPILRRLPRALAGLGRTMIRVGQLGRIFEAQAGLYRELIAHQSGQHWRMVEFDGSLQLLRDRLTTLQQLMGALEARTDLADHHIEQMFAAQQEFVNRSDVLAQLADLNARLSTLEGYPAQQQAQLAELASRIEAHLSEYIERQARINEQVQLNTSFVRLFQQQREIERAGDEPALAVISGGDLIHLIDRLERELPELAQHSAIELSIQDHLAEATLASGATYFGKRMSSSGESYRVPNDAWYHIDFTPNWNRDVLFESAVTRLAPGGHLIIVTLPEQTDPGDRSSLELIADRQLSLASGKEVRVYIWRAGE